MLWQVFFRLHKCNANETTNAKANTNTGGEGGEKFA